MDEPKNMLEHIKNTSPELQAARAKLTDLQESQEDYARRLQWATESENWEGAGRWKAAGAGVALGIEQAQHRVTQLETGLEEKAAESQKTLKEIAKESQKIAAMRILLDQGFTALAAQIAPELERLAGMAAEITSRQRTVENTADYADLPYTRNGYGSEFGAGGEKRTSAREILAAAGVDMAALLGGWQCPASDRPHAKTFGALVDLLAVWRGEKVVTFGALLR